MMPRLTFLRLIVLLSVGTILLFPIYTVYYEQPSFIALHRENTADEAARIATHLSSAIITDQESLTGDILPASLLADVKSLEKDPHFRKIKIYSLSGEVLYSTDPKDVGTVNNQPYFREIISGGKGRAQEVARNTTSLEKQFMKSDVVETYVPIILQGKMVGVFEVYYDVSAEKAKLSSLVNRSSGILSTMAAVLLGAVLISALKAKRSIQALEKAEKERERLIRELQQALAEIKKLSGFLPICASCKRIRDDKGYWNQIEKYISEHSEAHFTHGICPECSRKLYPDFSEHKK
jgi:hypothetical protein